MRLVLRTPGTPEALSAHQSLGGSCSRRSGSSVNCGDSPSCLAACFISGDLYPEEVLTPTPSVLQEQNNWSRDLQVTPTSAIGNSFFHVTNTSGLRCTSARRWCCSQRIRCFL